MEESPAWTARKLIRAARSGTLATATDGQPFASLVTPATAPAGSVGGWKVRRDGHGER